MPYRLRFLFLALTLSAALYAQQNQVREIIVPGADGEAAFAFQADTPDPDMRRVPQTILSLRQKNTDEFLRRLAEYITEKSSGDFDRIKKAHDWVALNIRYDVASYFSGRYRSQDYGTVLRQRLAVCAGYAEAFKSLSDALGIECKIVAGYARGAGRDPFKTEDSMNVNHDWNIVTIEGKQYLIDCTWDSGHLNGRSFQAKYRTAYLFTEPSAFINHHFPSDPAAQLIDPPLSAEAFRKCPFIDPRFAQSMESIPPLEKVTEINAGEEFNMEFSAKEGYEIIYGWYRSNGARLSRADTHPGRLDLYRLSLPKLKPGKYILRVWIRKLGARSHAGYAEFGFLINSAA